MAPAPCRYSETSIGAPGGGSHPPYGLVLETVLAHSHARPSPSPSSPSGSPGGVGMGPFTWSQSMSPPPLGIEGAVPPEPAEAEE